MNELTTGYFEPLYDFLRASVDGKELRINGSVYIRKCDFADAINECVIGIGALEYDVRREIRQADEIIEELDYIADKLKELVP